MYSLMLRAWLIASGERTARAIHRRVASLGSAAAQSEAAHALLPLLTPEEEGVFRRGRNAHARTLPKNARPEDYSYATALETLFGWLWLRGMMGRLGEVFRVCVEDSGHDSH